VKVGIIQSNYLPWRGYFDFIDEVDLFIFHDDLQYTKNDWRNRNKIKTDAGTPWITVSVTYKNTTQLICNTSIDYSTRWNKKHINQFKQWYSNAPFFAAYSTELFEILQRPFETISSLNITLCFWIMEKLDIKTPTRLSWEFAPQKNKTERLIDLLKKVHATSYLSGPAAKNYLDEDLFIQNRISLEYKSYDYAPYSQLWGDFIGEVTVLDLLFNMGPSAKNHLKSLTQNEIAVSV